MEPWSRWPGDCWKGRRKIRAPPSCATNAAPHQERREERSPRARTLGVPGLRAAKTPVAFPIDWQTGFQRIAPGEKLDRAILAANPSGFGVACGLALQGLEQSQVSIDLSGGRSGIGKVTHLLGLRSSSAWGLDIGSSSLKAVKLAWNKKAETANIETAALVEFKKPLSQTSGETEEQAVLEEALTTLIAQCELKGDPVCLGLPGRIVLSRLFQMPVTSRAKMAAMVEFEAKRHLPTHLDHLEWDFQPLSESDDDAGPAKKGVVSVLFAASRRNLVSKRLDLMRQVGIRVDMAQSECIALHNFLIFERSAVAEEADAPEASNGKPAPAAKAAKPSWPVAVIDIGGDGSHLLVSSPTELWVRHLGFGGYSISRTIIKQFGLTTSQAEELKRNPASAPNLGEFYRAIEPLADDFIRELGVSLNVYAKRDHSNPIQQLLGLGGGFQLHGLPAYLRTRWQT